MQRKRIRVPEGKYWDTGSIWHLTIAARERSANVFSDEQFAQELMRTTEVRCVARHAILELYCLMPNHLHLLILTRDIGFVDVVGDVKSHTTRLSWSYGSKGTLWQRSFHDHQIRGDKDYNETIRYIVENPVKAGLVDDWTDYAFTGGSLITPISPSPTKSGGIRQTWKCIAPACVLHSHVARRGPRVCLSPQRGASLRVSLCLP